jgi:geranylgeranyl transferase type-1 subunit beta
MSYTALALLAMLGDDLAAVDRPAVLRLVRSLQGPTGAFSAFAGGESDMRFVFCAAAICTMLGDPQCSTIDVEHATAYILSSQSYDGGIGLGPGMESHGGSMYTGLAALALMGKHLATPACT